MDYIIEFNLEDFLTLVPKNWNKLMLGLIGETLLNVEYINGIRFVDKTLFSKKTMFRFELWVNKDIPENEISKMKEFYGKEYGCSGISVKNIEIKK
jgi:hypothetical protein